MMYILIAVQPTVHLHHNFLILLDWNSVPIKH